MAMIAVSFNTRYEVSPAVTVAVAGAGSWPWHASAAACVLASLSVGLVGCDRASQLEESVSTEVQVRKEFGEPRTITVAPDGSRTFDYPRQPEGWTNYVIKLGADGKVTSIRQLLTPDNFAKVTPGLTQLEVRSILGRPATMTPYALKKEEVWTWRFKQNGQDSKLFSVTFNADGQVLSSAVGDDPRESMTGGKH
jgi:outer membrane protein assembly factor BamE (lipoprotein component of BamABCDE complex)